MPWCPKCGSEYRAGFTKCADCGSELVEEQPILKPQVPAWLEGMPEEYVKEALDSGADENAMRSQMAAMQMMQSQQGGEAPKQQPRRAANRDVYRASADKANENTSAGWMFLCVGAIGFVALVLGFFGVLPIPVKSNMFFYGVLAAMFLFFIGSGIMSLRNAKTYTAQAESENSVRNTLIEWCKENLKADEIDAITQTTNDPEEIQYFKRISYMKYILNKQYVNLDQAFLDNFIDEYLYDSIYEADN